MQKTRKQLLQIYTKDILLLAYKSRLTVWNRIFINLEPNLLIYENTNYIGLKLDLNRYNFRVGFWILGKNRPERSVYIKVNVKQN